MAELDGRPDSTDDTTDSPDDKIIKEAQRRFNFCSEWESEARNRYVEDVKFANADSDNMYQWSSAIQTARGIGTAAERPSLTINDTRQHCLQIINDARQNKPSVKIKATGNGATYESAQIFEGCVRHIEYISNAQAAYDTATTYQVWGGIGYWRVVTDYAGDDSFDQEIFLRRIKDPLSVYQDPDIREADGSDAKFGFVFDDMPRKEFELAYPKFKDVANANPLSKTDASWDWIQEDHVRVAEYYRVVEDKDHLVAFAMPMTGEQVVKKKSEIDRELFKSVVDHPETKTREIIQNRVEWYLIVGNKIAERNVWPGKYIPIVRVIGEETVIDGHMDRKGHVRAMKDPQRMSNYWFSAAVEQVALQGKSPYIGEMAAFENLETYWSTANTVNHAWIPFNAYDDAGRKIEAPQRQAPPVMATAYIQGLSIAADKMRAVSGQYQSEMGAPSNEKSGIAIQQRQRQGDNATYHYIDNLALAIRFTGKILVDLIPKIYDTPRIIKIMAEDGVENSVTIDPKAQAAYLQKQKAEKDKIESIFNPNVGKYDVEADVGPAYATRRQEAFNAFTEIMRGNPDLMKVAGDLMFKAADFPMANELAERLKRLVPPEVMGEAPPPQVQEMGQQVQNLQGIIKQLMEELAEAKRDSGVKEDQKEIDTYKALTERLKVLLPTMINPADIAKMTHDLIKQEQSANFALESASHSAELSQTPQPDDGGSVPAPQPDQAQPQMAAA